MYCYNRQRMSTLLQKKRGTKGTQYKCLKGKKKRAVFTRTTNVTIEFLTKGYLDARHLFSCTQKKSEEKIQMLLATQKLYQI